MNDNFGMEIWTIWLMIHDLNVPMAVEHHDDTTSISGGTTIAIHLHILHKHH